MNSTNGLKSSGIWSFLRSQKRKFNTYFENKFGFDLDRYTAKNKKKVMQISYDETWNAILTHNPSSKKNIPGAFVGWDNTPRKGVNGRVFIGDTPEKFKEYLTKQVRRVKDVYKKDIMFMYAWNEWAEGGYLEPDERTGYRNLEAIRDALKENHEFPW